MGVCRESWPSSWLYVTAVIIGGLCTKSAKWSFSDANLALQLTAASNGSISSRLDVTFHPIFGSLTIFPHFHGILILYEYSGRGTTHFYTTFYWCDFTAIFLILQEADVTADFYRVLGLLVCLFIYSSIHTEKQKHNFTREVQFEKDKTSVWIKWPPTQGDAWICTCRLHSLCCNSLYLSLLRKLSWLW